MDTMKKQFTDLGFDLSCLKTIVYLGLDPNPQPDDCGLKCTGGCTGGCYTCSPGNQNG